MNLNLPASSAVVAACAVPRLSTTVAFRTGSLVPARSTTPSMDPSACDQNKSANSAIPMGITDTAGVKLFR